MLGLNNKIFYALENQIDLRGRIRTINGRFGIIGFRSRRWSYEI